MENDFRPFFSGTYFITANWERDDYNFSKIGTGLTESSEFLLFQAQEYITFKQTFYQPSGNDVTYAGGEIYVTTDNANYNADTEVINLFIMV